MARGIKLGAQYKLGAKGRVASQVKITKSFQFRTATSVAGFLMERKLLKCQALLIGLLCALDITRVSADVGTATSYGPPYLPTKCSGYNQDQLPGNGLFVAAGNGVWDNGAACGRKYRLRCLSGLRRPCKDGTIVVEVVDLCRNRPCSSTLVLSNEAFDAVSKIPNTKINVEYTQI
ncbi:EG45-like domain containing protein [Phoenix dactylifera]|uniref:EG45-like domain containing protein n=1 Tax=Phoenix dactylifera TaxID=42345 RepID=A0A8B7C560_PHODC|nr:EG45-like domain containing protein [Phoenix dactylifera]